MPSFTGRFSGGHFLTDAQVAGHRGLRLFRHRQVGRRGSWLAVIRTIVTCTPPARGSSAPHSSDAPLTSSTNVLSPACLSATAQRLDLIFRSPAPRVRQCGPESPAPSAGLPGQSRGDTPGSRFYSGAQSVRQSQRLGAALAHGCHRLDGEDVEQPPDRAVVWSDDEQTRAAARGVARESEEASHAGAVHEPDLGRGRAPPRPSLDPPPRRPPPNARPWKDRARPSPRRRRASSA